MSNLYIYALEGLSPESVLEGLKKLCWTTSKLGKSLPIIGKVVGYNFDFINCGAFPPFKFKIQATFGWLIYVCSFI